MTLFLDKVDNMKIHIRFSITSITFIALFYFSLVGFSFAVTNQELMDRLDDIEIEQQNREMNRLLDQLLEKQLRNISHHSNTNEKVVKEKAEGNYKKLQDGEVLRWMRDRECYILWDKNLQIISNPLKQYKFREITQLDSLVAIIYFPNSFNDVTIKSLVNKEAFLKIKSVCANR